MKHRRNLFFLSIVTIASLLFSNVIPVFAGGTNSSDAVDYKQVMSIPLKNSGLEYQNNGEGYLSGPKSFAIYGKSIYILDGEKNIVFIFNNGKKVNEFKVKGLLAASDIRVSKDIIYVVDKESNKLASFMQDGKQISLVDLNTTSNEGSLTLDIDKDDSVLLKDGNSMIRFNKDLTKLNDKRNFFKFNKNTKQKGNVVIPESETKIELNFNELIGTVNLNHIDKKGNIYITTEEVVDAPEIIVEQTVKKYDPAGVQIGVARVPLELYAAHPYRYTDVTDDGIFALVPKVNSIDVVELITTNNFSSKLPQLKQAFYKNYKAPESTSTSKNSSISGVVATSLTRSQVEHNGYYINENSFTLNTSNRKTISGVTFPDWLASVSIPYKATGIPYCWGGFDSLNTSSSSSWSNYNSAMSYGANAGNVKCSGYYKSGTAGLDCSGYVSACFGFTSKWGTDTFYSNTSLFKDITVSQLKNCDIVVHRTAHIVLWKGLDATNTDHFFTYEATTSGLDKCKPYDRNWSSLSGYKCRTYINFS